MKYLYIRLSEYEIITFKSVATCIDEGLIKVCFNGSEGCFKKVETTDEAETIVDSIMYYLKQDAPMYRILDLRKIH